MRILVYGAGVLGCELAHVLMQNKKERCHAACTRRVEGNDRPEGFGHPPLGAAQDHNGTDQNRGHSCPG